MSEELFIVWQGHHVVNPTALIGYYLVGSFSYRHFHRNSHNLCIFVLHKQQIENKQVWSECHTINSQRIIHGQALMWFLFKCLTQMLTSECSNLGRCQVEQEKRNFMSTSCVLCFPQGWKSLCNTIVNMINREWHMGTCWCGISLQVFNSIAHKWDIWVKHTKKNFISTSNHVLFCLSYKHNSPLLRRKVNFIDEWNRTIGNPRIKIVKCFDAMAQDGKIRWNATETNNGPNFQYTKFSFIDLVLTDKRNLSGKWPKSACSRSIDFCCQLQELHYKSHWIHNF